MADKKKQLVTNVAVGYILVSVVLFAIFIFTYRMYWYRIHRKVVEDKAQQSEEVFLIRAMRPFLLEKRKRKARSEAHTELLTRVGSAMLDELEVRLKDISHEDPIEDFEAPDPEPKFRETPIESDGEKRLDELLKPVMPKSGDGPFESIVRSMSERTRGLIEFRVFENGIEQMVPLHWSFVGSKQMELRGENGDVLSWDLRAYVNPIKSKKVELKDVEDDFEDLAVGVRQRLGIYSFGELDPIYKGGSYSFVPTTLDHYEERSQREGKPRYDFPEPLQLRGSHLGEEMDKLRMRSFLSDPDLKLTFVLERDIYEYEWADNNFMFRNRVPILTYAVMAWLVCPFVFWFAVKRTNRFQFQFTADLEGEEDHFASSMVPSDPLDLQSEDRPYVEEREKSGDESDGRGSDVTGQLSEDLLESEESSDSEKPVEQKAESVTQKNDVSEISEKKEAPSSPSVGEGPLTRRLRDPAEMGQPLDRGDVDEIRQNNIRKSSGSFNRNHDNEEDVDYLAGVESDVLKSLIKKLREQ